jgi:hypothetical protein
MKTSVLSALFLTLLATACGPNPQYQQPYYQQQPVIVQPYQQPVVVPSPYFQPRPILVPNTVTTTERVRTVSPVQVQQQQPGSNAVRATMQPAATQQAVAPATQNLSDRAGQARSFQVQQGTQQRATGFGAKAQSPAPQRSAPAARPPVQFRKPGR